MSPQVYTTAFFSHAEHSCIYLATSMTSKAQSGGQNEKHHLLSKRHSDNNSNTRLVCILAQKHRGEMYRKFKHSLRQSISLAFSLIRPAVYTISYFMWHAFIVISHVNKMRFLYSFLLVIYIYIELASERLRVERGWLRQEITGRFHRHCVV